MATSAPAPIDLVGLITAGQNFGAATTEALTQLDAASGVMAKAGAAGEQAARDKASADAEAGLLLGEKKLANEAAAKNVMAMFGTDPTVSDATVRQLSSRIISDSTEIRASKEAIQKKMSVGIADDFFQWLENQFTLPTDAAIHNVKVAARDADQETLAKLQTATKEQIAIAAAADSGTSTAILAAQARGKAALGVEEAARWSFETQRAGISVLQVRSALDSKQLEVSFHLFQAKNAEEQLQLSKAAGARDQERLTLQKEVEGYKVAALKDDAEGKKLWNERYNAVRATLNLPASSIVEFKNLPKPQQDAWDKLMNSPDLAKGRFGSTPADSLILARTLGVQLPGASNVTAEFVEGVYRSVLSKNESTWKSYAPEVQRNMVNKAVEEKLKQDAVNIPEQGSLLSIGSLQSAMKIPALQEGVGKLFFDELAPLAKDPTYNTKPRDFAATAIKLVQAGTLDTATASSQIATTFKALAQDNAEVKQFRRFAVSGKIAEKYVVPIDTGFGLGTTTSVDWTNSVAVENALNRMIAIKEHTKMGAGTAFR